MKIRIHHFYDIIRSFGIDEEIKPHPDLHSYHKVAELIRNDPALTMEIVVGTDDTCTNCLHLKNEVCKDVISHRKDFNSKEKFNNYLDKRILDICLIEPGTIFTSVQLCEKAKLYLENIEWIYAGNDPDHTLTRKQKVIDGLRYYSKKYHFSLAFLN